MIKPKQVPKESLVAYQRAFKNGGGPADGIAAALNAWPGMRVSMLFPPNEPHVVLPLQQENSDDQ